VCSSDLGHSIAPHNETTNNWVGSMGAEVSYRTYRMLGPGVWIVLAGWLTFLGAAAIGKPVTSMIRRFVGLLLMCVAASTVLGLGSVNTFSQPEGAGGLIAIATNAGLLPLVSVMGTVLLMTMVFLIGSIMAADQVVLTGAHHFGRLCLNLTNVRWPRPVLVGALDGLKHLPSRLKRSKVSGSPLKPTSKSKRNASSADTLVIELEEEVVEEGEFEWEYYDEDGNLIEAEADDEWEYEEEDEEGDDEVESVADEDDQTVEEADNAEEEEVDFTPEALRAKIKQLPINFAPKQKKIGRAHV